MPPALVCFADDAEADVEHALPRLVAQTAAGSRQVGPFAPGAAADDSPRVGCGLTRVIGPERIRQIGTGGPLGDVAVHVVDAPGVRPVRADRRGDGLSVVGRFHREERFDLLQGGLSAEVQQRRVGQIREGVDAVTQARAYATAGADCLSVLTETTYFKGELKDLIQVVQDQPSWARPLPCIRKDFMVHPYQVLEAAQAGARCILVGEHMMRQQDVAVAAHDLVHAL